MSFDDCIKEVAGVLRFFATKLRNYGYVDRIANSLTPEPAEMALLEALRHLRTLYDAAKIDKDKNLRYIITDDGTVYLPKIPSQDCLSEVLKMLVDDKVRRKLAILSLSYYGR